MPSHYFALLNKASAVEECDATMFNSSTTAKYKKNYMKKIPHYCTILFIVFTSSNASVKSMYSSATGNTMVTADSLYYAQNWSAAKELYEKLLGDTSHNSIAWNRLGFSNYNLGNYYK
jgi:hypothetical protein